MDKIVNDVFECLSNFIDITEESKIKLNIRIQVRKCLNYMNRSDFPEELVEPLAEAMALEYLESSEREVKRVTAGDTSIEYNTSSSVEDRVTITMREQLNRYRRVGTIGNTKIK
ncbi:hypothetical protein [uncultured Fusobacterium sp.]|uniref:hypothetical protein n=1 Tax=uncultured Fusobacterium sp. TaxID=159267 RepID=UPI0025F8AC2A|nr:hypothetical protein [uncultured Fusobacterium sp.]